METKKLYRSRTDRMVAGICGGIAEYSGVDAAIVRMLAVVVILATGLVPGVIAYIFGMFIIPLKPITA